MSLRRLRRNTKNKPGKGGGVGGKARNYYEAELGDEGIRGEGGPGFFC